jgi:hypothetical protein
MQRPVSGDPGEKGAGASKLGRIAKPSFHGPVSGHFHAHRMLGWQEAMTEGDKFEDGIQRER